MRRLLFVRHGESEANAAGSLDCAVPGPGLTELGHAQADALAAELAGEDIRAVWASSMTRAQQTAAPLAAKLGLEVRIHPDLREADVGDLHPRSDNSALWHWNTLYARWLADGELADKRPGGESAADVIRRYVPAVREIVGELADGGTAVIVSHGAASRLVLAGLCPEVSPLYALEHHLDNTDVVDVEVTGDGDFRCVSWAGKPL
ncbi:MAG TPA: histidine phosphatase family protein [Mycobacteriales bacterium]